MTNNFQFQFMVILTENKYNLRSVCLKNLVLYNFLPCFITDDSLGLGRKTMV